MTQVSNVAHGSCNFVSNNIDAGSPPKPAAQDDVVCDARPARFPSPPPAPMSPAPSAPTAVAAPVVRTGHDYWQPVTHTRSLKLHDEVKGLGHRRGLPELFFDGRWVVTTETTYSRGAMALWDVATGNLEATFEDLTPMDRVAVHGAWIAVQVVDHPRSNDDGAALKIVSHETGQLGAVLPSDRFGTFCFWGDDRIIHVDGQGNIRVSNVNTGGCERTLPATSDASPYAFAVNHDTIAGAFHDGSVALWNLDGTPRAQYKAHEGKACAIAFTSRDVVSGGEDGCVVFANRNTGEIKRRFKAMDAPVESLSFTKHSVVTAGSLGNGVYVWDRRGNLLQAINEPNDGDIWPVMAVGNTVVGLTKSDVIKIWEPAKDA